MVRGKSFVNARMGTDPGTVFHVERSPLRLSLLALTALFEKPLTVRDRLHPVDAIVVLGARVQPGGRLSRSAAERVLCAVQLHQQGWAPVLLFTGGGAAELPAEADEMAAEALRLGVPGDALLVETSSRNTWENAAFSADVLRARKLRSAIVVTHAFHCRRTKRAFLRRGISALAHPVSSTWMREGDPRALELVLREYVALAIDLLGGRR